MKKFYKGVIKEMNKCKKITRIYYNHKFLAKIAIRTIKNLKELYLNLIRIEKITKILINIILLH